jgi:hypothetical protein
MMRHRNVTACTFQETTGQSTVSTVTVYVGRHDFPKSLRTTTRRRLKPPSIRSGNSARRIMSPELNVVTYPSLAGLTHSPCLAFPALVKVPRILLPAFRTDPTGTIIIGRLQLQSAVLRRRILLWIRNTWPRQWIADILVILKPPHRQQSRDIASLKRNRAKHHYRKDPHPDLVVHRPTCHWREEDGNHGQSKRNHKREQSSYVGPRLQNA